MAGGFLLYLPSYSDWGGDLCTWSTNGHTVVGTDNVVARDIGSRCYWTGGDRRTSTSGWVDRECCNIGRYNCRTDISASRTDFLVNGSNTSWEGPIVVGGVLTYRVEDRIYITLALGIVGLLELALWIDGDQSNSQKNRQNSNDDQELD